MRTHPDDERWRVAFVGATVLIALAVVAALAVTAPELGPRRPRPDRGPAPVLDSTTARPAPVTEREAGPDTTGREAPHTPVGGATSRGFGATAQTDRRTVESVGATAQPGVRAEAPSASPAPAATERPSVQNVIPAERKAAAAPGRQASTARAGGSAAAREAPTGFWRDQAISYQVATSLAFNRNLYRSRIQVESAGGVVTLRGQVLSREQVAHAIAVARNVYGVREVRSELHVGALDYVFPDSAIGLQ